MDLKALQNLIKSEAGRPLKEWLLSHYSRLNNLHNLKDLDDPIEMGIEVKATLKSVKFIEEILSEFITLEGSEEIKKSDKDKLFQL